MFLKILKFLWELILKMKWPKINKYSTRTVSVPALSGGVNLRDAVNLVNDNQLTDCKNMWYKDGVLKTRPGLAASGGLLYDDVYGVGDTIYGKLKNENIKRSKNGKEYGLVSRHTVFWSRITSDSELYPASSHIQFYLVGNDVIELPAISSFNGGFTNYFVVEFKNDLLCFCKPYYDTAPKIIYKLSEGENEWHELTDDEIYVPTVVTNCKSYGLDFEKEQEYKGNYGGVMFEGYNLLTPYYKMIYSTVNKELLDANDPTSSHVMIYEVFDITQRTADLIGKKIKATIKNALGMEYVHELTIPDDFLTRRRIKETTDPGDGLYMSFDANTLSFCQDALLENSAGVAYVTIDDYVENNLEIIVPYSNYEETCNKVFGMSESIWFGSDALGISGGTRLFLGGNESEGNLVIWSDLNRPTYFSENNYAYVGDKSQRVTAFGRQNDTLVIFKEREIYYTQYARNSEITAEELINQSVVDYSASAVYFPIVQLHAAIGCDCPQTVQLCRNYLVWAHSDGNVYTLRSQNQYSERNVYCVSDMIKRDLKNNDLKNAYAADYDGHYFLFIGGNAYAMDYNSYGYININSYNKSEDAQMRIPWWKWEFSDNLDFGIMMLGGNGLCFFENIQIDQIFYDFDKTINVFVIKEAEKYDNGNLPIKSYFTTKIFDFGAAHLTKRVPLVNIGFGGHDTAGIKVSFISDSGTEKALPILYNGKDVDEYSAEYVVNRQFRPSRIVTRMGVRIENEGNLSVGNISLDYTLLGGAK